MGFYRITEDFEKEFPGLFERVCFVFYGDIEDSRIEVSGESTDIHGIQRECEATVTFDHLIVELSFEDGINAGSAIHDYESYPVDDSLEGLHRYRQSCIALADTVAIEVEDYVVEFQERDIEL